MRPARPERRREPRGAAARAAARVVPPARPERRREPLGAVDRAAAPARAVPDRFVDPRLIGAVFAGGALGTLVRAELADLLQAKPGQWPWSTLIANLLGAFLLGYFTTRLQERLPPSVYRRPLLGTGFCGGLTTFSTMQIELLQMLDQARYGLAAVYAGVSIGGGFVAVAIATNLVRRARWRG